MPGSLSNGIPMGNSITSPQFWLLEMKIPLWIAPVASKQICLSGIVLTYLHLLLFAVLCGTKCMYPFVIAVYYPSAWHLHKELRTIMWLEVILDIALNSSCSEELSVQYMLDWYLKPGNINQIDLINLADMCTRFVHSMVRNQSRYAYFLLCYPHSPHCTI